MREDIEEIIEVPENVEVSLDGALTMKGPLGTITRKFQFPVELNGKKVRLFYSKGTKNQKKMIMTTKAHINNMIKGVLEGFEYNLQIVFVHFPMTVRMDKDKFFVKNFLGESKERVAQILANTTVKIAGDKITVTSVDKEAAGQTAANIEQSTRITNRDRRIFQDGIWMTKTPDKNILE